VSTTARTPDPDRDLEAFLALLAARRSPRTVDAYRRDLTALGAFLGGPVSRASLDDLERYMAQLRADGLSPATLARRTASARTYFRHLQLIGARADNPAAELTLPRRVRTLPRTLSAGEAERLIDAAGRARRELREVADVGAVGAARVRGERALRAQEEIEIAQGRLPDSALLRARLCRHPACARTREAYASMRASARSASRSFFSRRVALRGAPSSGGKSP
jgi:hypothetical protein